MYEKIIDIFFPRKCPICEEALKGKEKICRECAKEIKVIKEPKCYQCGRPLLSEEQLYCIDCTHKEHYFERGIAVFEYEDNLQKSLYRFKYKNKREYADFYGYIAAKNCKTQLKEWKIDGIIPVPIHHKRKLKRGYNQAYIFAKAIKKYTGIPIQTKALIRVKNTAPQKGLADEMRYYNLKGAFLVNVEKLKGLKNVLLIDDIYTTGSTVDTCSFILKKAGVKKVYVLCISTERG